MDSLRIEALRRDDWRKYSGMVAKLVKQLSPNADPVDGHDFFNVVGQDEENFTVFIIRHAYGPETTPEGEFIGMATIFFRHLLSGWVGEIHDVVVDEKYYRQGYGRKLTAKIFEYTKMRAEKLGKPIKLSLTSKPAREAANAMYVAEGFQLAAQAVNHHDPCSGAKIVSGTNLYTKTIDP